MDNNTTWMSLNTVGGISSNGIYDFHLRSFGSNSVNRVDIRVQHGHATYLNMASNSIISNQPVLLKFKKSGIIIGIPSNMMNGTKYMISVDSMKNSKYVDRAGWYTVNVL